MSSSLKDLFSNRRIPPDRRVLSPFLSALLSFFIPGAAQAVNGQRVKGICLLAAALACYSLTPVSPALFTIALYMMMVAVSSDAYFIASRMKLGEEVRAWSILFLAVEAPSHSPVAGARGTGRVLIAGAQVCDGTGAPPFTADVLLEGGVIRYIRPSIASKEKEYTVVEGQGKILIPGVINPCCCAEAAVFAAPGEPAAVRQGITTEILGQNGQSLAPAQGPHREACESLFDAVHGRREKKRSYENTGLYLMDLEKLPTPAQTESMVGYGTLRANLLGFGAGPPGEEALTRLCARVRSALASGAKGISLGLAYPPCCLAADGELLAVCRAAAEAGGLVAVQLAMGEGALLPSFERMARIALESKAAMLFTNLHACGEDGRLAERFCARLREFRAAGAKLSLAVTGLSSQRFGLLALLPKGFWEKGGIQPAETERAALQNEIARAIDALGGPGRILLEERDREAGDVSPKSLTEAAALRQCSPAGLVLALLREQDGAVAATLQTQDREFMARLVAEGAGICADGPDGAVSHFFGTYALGGQILPLEEAVRRATMEQAARFGLWDRGLIREGMSADLVLLRSELLPRGEGETARGIAKVWVRGVLQVDTEPTLDTASLPRTRVMGISLGR